MSVKKTDINHVTNAVDLYDRFVLIPTDISQCLQVLAPKVLMLLFLYLQFQAQPKITGTTAQDLA